MAEFVSVDRLDAIGVLRLDRPPVNSLSRQMLGEVVDAVQMLAEADDVRAVVVHGGDKVFATVTDMAELAETTREQIIASVPATVQGLRALGALRVPTVAAIGGYAVGGGASLSLGADRRIVGDHVKFAFPEVMAGIVPVGLDRLSRLVGPSRAKDLVFTGRFVDAEEALAIGLVDEVVAPDAVFDAALEWARAVSTGAPVALAAAKSLIDSTGAESEAPLERQLVAEVYATDDRGAGIRSYLEHGPGRAVFTGR